GNARVAVQFVLNYEEGGESCVLHGDQGSEQFLSEIIGAAAYPARHLTMRAAAAQGEPAWQARWERAVEHLGVPVHRMPSGAGQIGNAAAQRAAVTTAPDQTSDTANIAARSGAARVFPVRSS